MTSFPALGLMTSRGSNVRKRTFHLEGPGLSLTLCLRGWAWTIWPLRSTESSSATFSTVRRTAQRIRSAVKLLLTNTKGLTPLLLNWTLATVLYLRQGWIGWIGWMGRGGVKASVWVRSGGEGKRRDRERGIVWKITQVKGATVSQQCGGSVRDTVTNRLRQRCVFREDAQSQK